MLHAESIAAPAAEFDAYYAIGKLLYDNDEFRKAADVFRLAALLEPTRGEVWWALGACHEQEGELGVAALLYETGYHLGEQSPELGLLATRAFFRAGERGKADEMIAELARARLDVESKERLKRIEWEMKGEGSCR